MNNYWTVKYKITQNISNTTGIWTFKYILRSAQNLKSLYKDTDNLKEIIAYFHSMETNLFLYFMTLIQWQLS